MANKVTKKDNFNALLALDAVQAKPELVKFIEHELDLLARKNTSEKKPTAQQLANEGIKGAILAHMGEHPDRLFTIGELMKEVPECSDLTNQRVSAIVSALKKAELVERHEDKRKAYFRIAR